MEELDHDDETKVFYCKMGLKEFPPISKKVRVLEVRRNMLKAMVFPQDSALEFLDISDNLIKSMDPVSGLLHLKVLDIGYNLIQNIPKLELPALEELYLMSNDIYEIKNFNFENLIKCDLANNELKSLEGINCPMLQEAYFGANKIARIQDMTYLKFLKVLDLQYNMLEEVDCKHLPQSIETLLLNNSKRLSKLHSLDHLINLKMLGIKNTRITDVEINGKFEIW